DLFLAQEEIYKQMDNIIRKTKSLPKAQGFDEISIPGEPEERTMSERLKNGVPVSENVLDDLRAELKKAGLSDIKLYEGVDWLVKFAYAFQTTETKKQLLSAKGDPEEVVKKLADIGYDAVELLVREPKKSEFGHLMKMMERNNLETASLGTGPMAADDGLAFCSADNTIRKEAVKRIFELSRWAAEFRSTINIGKLRGNIDENNH